MTTEDEIKALEKQLETVKAQKARGSWGNYYDIQINKLEEKINKLKEQKP